MASCISSASTGSSFLQCDEAPLSLERLCNSLLPSALFEHISLNSSSDSAGCDSSSGTSGSISGGSGGGSIGAEHLPAQLDMASAWKPAADPVLGSYRSFGSVSSIPQQQQQQHQQQQQQKGGKGRRRGQQEEDIPKQYATSTVFFAGVSPIATEAGLASVFEQFGNIIKVNLFRPYKTCKTSKVCTECRIGAGWGGGAEVRS
jgi:hypothetical protein